MRISDWSSDVCSSDLRPGWRAKPGCIFKARSGEKGKEPRDVDADRHRRARRPCGRRRRQPARHISQQFLHAADRKRVVEGKSVSVRVDFGGRRISKKNKPIEKQKDKSIHTRIP